MPRPPIFRRPKRANGAEQVVMLGVTLRITITEDGSDGMSYLEDIVNLCTGGEWPCEVSIDVLRMQLVYVQFSNRDIKSIYDWA